jgi:plasmid maintenance system killer protein
VFEVNARPWPRVRANWRIVFRFEETDAFDVELIDYH